jgi:hypothetical protein
MELLRGTTVRCLWGTAILYVGGENGNRLSVVAAQYSNPVPSKTLTILLVLLKR